MSSSFEYRDVVAVVQIVFFSIYLAGGIFLCARHGWNRTSGFLILINFCILRLLGASFQLATMTYPTRSIYGGALVCEAIGVSPLTILNVGMLARLNRFLPPAKQIGKKLFGAISLVSMIGIGIAVKGGIDAAQATVPGTPNTFTKLAIILFLVIYLAGVAIYVMLCMTADKSLLPHGEQRLLVSFAVCAPLILVRLLYPLIADFSNNRTFFIFGGDPNIWLGMTVVEELLVVGIVVGVGMTLRKLPASPDAAQDEDEERGQEKKTPQLQTRTMED